jgi:hypothetical protein
MTDYASIVAAGVSLLGSIIVALVAWGWRAEIGTLRAEMNTLKAEMRASIAESVNSFYQQVNGSYIKRDLYNTLLARVDNIENRVNELGD